jgi:hypothetical protein
MAAVGFSKLSGDVLALEGTQPPSNRRQDMAPLSKALLTLLEERLAEVEAELAAIDAAPSVPAAVRLMRTSGCSLSELQAALDTAISCVSNILRNPKVCVYVFESLIQ